MKPEKKMLFSAKFMPAGHKGDRTRSEICRRRDTPGTSLERTIAGPDGRHCQGIAGHRKNPVEGLKNSMGPGDAESPDADREETHSMNWNRKTASCSTGAATWSNSSRSRKPAASSPPPNGSPSPSRRSAVSLPGSRSGSADSSSNACLRASGLPCSGSWPPNAPVTFSGRSRPRKRRSRRRSPAAPAASRSPRIRCGWRRSSPRRSPDTARRCPASSWRCARRRSPRACGSWRTARATCIAAASMPARPLAVSLKRLFQDQLIQRQIRDRLPETAILLLQVLQTLGLVSTKAAIFGDVPVDVEKLR